MAVIQDKFLVQNGLDNNNNTLSNVANPVNSQDAATKSYVDTRIDNIVNFSEGTVPMGSYVLFPSYTDNTITLGEQQFLKSGVIVPSDGYPTLPQDFKRKLYPLQEFSDIGNGITCERLLLDKDNNLYLMVYDDFKNYKISGKSELTSSDITSTNIQWTAMPAYSGSNPSTRSEIKTLYKYNGIHYVVHEYGGTLYVSVVGGNTTIGNYNVPYTSIFASGTSAILSVDKSTSTNTVKRLYGAVGNAITNVTLPASKSWAGIAHSDNVFVLLAIDGTVYRSTDSGATWSAGAAISGTWTSLYGFDSGGGFIAVANTGLGLVVARSANGTSWTTQTYPFVLSPCNDVTYNPTSSKYLLCFDDVDYVLSLNTSLVSTSVTLPKNAKWRCVRWSPIHQTFFLGSDNGLYFSDNGTTWKLKPTPKTGFSSLYQSQTRLVAFRSFYSEGSATLSELPYETVDNGNISGAYSVNPGLSRYGKFAVSQDGGSTWTYQKFILPDDYAFYYLGFVNDRFIRATTAISGSSYNIILSHSTDGINWTSVTISSAGSYNSSMDAYHDYYVPCSLVWNGTYYFLFRKDGVCYRFNSTLTSYSTLSNSSLGGTSASYYYIVNAGYWSGTVNKVAATLSLNSDVYVAMLGYYMSTPSGTYDTVTFTDPKLKIWKSSDNGSTWSIAYESQTDTGSYPSTYSSGYGPYRIDRFFFDTRSNTFLLSYSAKNNGQYYYSPYQKMATKYSIDGGTTWLDIASIQPPQLFGFFDSGNSVSYQQTRSNYTSAVSNITYIASAQDGVIDFSYSKSYNLIHKYKVYSSYYYGNSDYFNAGSGLIYPSEPFYYTYNGTTYVLGGGGNKIYRIDTQEYVSNILDVTPPVNSLYYMKVK